MLTSAVDLIEHIVRGSAHRRFKIAVIPDECASSRLVNDRADRATILSDSLCLISQINGLRPTTARRTTTWWSSWISLVLIQPLWPADAQSNSLIRFVDLVEWNHSLDPSPVK